MTLADGCLTAAVFVFGACWGSFLNVCICRIPAGLSVIRPSSRCPTCKTPLAWKDNIPILGWMALHGKCRYCKAPISLRYPAIELLTAVLFALVWTRYPYELVVLPYWLMICGLILAGVVDFDEMWIPDRCTIGGMIAGPILSFLIPAMQTAKSPLEGLVFSLIGITAGLGLLWSVAVVGKLLIGSEAMGLGDIKLLGALGSFLGWKAVIFIVFTASLSGSIIGVLLIAAGRKKRWESIPFGPYIAFSAVFWIFGGTAVLNAYKAYWFGGLSGLL